VSFLAYFVALIIAVGSVLFGLEVVISPSPNHNQAVRDVGAPSALNKLAKREADHAEHDIAANRMLTRVYPANPGEVRTLTAPGSLSTETTGVSPPPDKATEGVLDKGTRSVFQAANVSAAPEASTATAKATVAQSPVAQPAPLERQFTVGSTWKAAGNCDIEACTSAYRSFRAFDCSYQPFEGPRRACVAPHAMQARKGLGSEFRFRGIVRAAMTRAPRYEESPARDDDAADAAIDDDEEGSVIFFQGPSGWFR
jgi:hypothetical protein